MALVLAYALIQSSLSLDSKQERLNGILIALCSWTSEKMFVVLGFSSLFLAPSAFCLVAIFQSVALALMLSYFSSSFLYVILPFQFQKNVQVKDSSNLTPANKAKVSAKP